MLLIDNNIHLLHCLANSVVHLVRIMLYALQVVNTFKLQNDPAYWSLLNRPPPISSKGFACFFQCALEQSKNKTKFFISSNAQFSADGLDAEEPSLDDASDGVPPAWRRRRTASASAAACTHLTHWRRSESRVGWVRTWSINERVPDLRQRPAPAPPSVRLFKLFFRAA